MILLGYAAGVVLLWCCLRRKSEGLRSAVFMAYHFLFVFALSFSLLYTPGLSPAELARTLALSVYQAPMIMGFQVGLDDYTQLQYIIIFVCSSIYTVRTVVMLLFQRFFRDLRLRLSLLLRPEVCLISGELPDAQALAENIRREKRRVSLLYLDPNPDEDDEIPVSGALTVQWSQVEKLTRRKRCHAVLLPEPNQENLSLLGRFEQLGRPLSRLKVTAFLDPDLLRLEKLNYPATDVWLVSRDQLLARHFMTEHLPLERLKAVGAAHTEDHIWVPDRPFSLCVAGFSTMCREFLLTTMENTAFETAAPDGRGLDALIISDALPDHLGAFLRDYPRLAEEPGLSWLDHGAETEPFFSALERRLAGLDQILVDVGSTSDNIRAALRIQRLCQRHELAVLPQLVVVLHEDAPGSVELLTQSENVIFLQDNRSRFTYEELIERRADQEARALHQRYQSVSGSDIDAWQKLDTFTQTSNRAVLWDIPNKLALTAEDLNALPPAEREKALWRLARYEHRRWNAFHFCRGWTKLDVSELTPEELAQHKTKRPAARRHICLVSWDELDGLPQSSPGILKRYDYENAAAVFHQ